MSRPRLDGEPLSYGEIALIRALRESKIKHVPPAGEAEFECVLIVDEKMISAIKTIEAEKEATG